MTKTRKPNFKPAYKRSRSTRQDVVIYVGAVTFLIGYLFGTGFFSFSIG